MAPTKRKVEIVGHPNFGVTAGSIPILDVTKMEKCQITLASQYIHIYIYTYQNVVHVKEFQGVLSAMSGIITPLKSLALTGPEGSSRLAHEISQ